MPSPRNRKLSAFALILAVLTLATALAADPEETFDTKSVQAHNARALPDAFLVTLSLEEGDQTYEFATVTASRRFTLAPPERRLDFHGNISLQQDGRELLDFTVEFQQRFPRADDAGGGSFTRVGTWRGSTYVDTDREIQIIRNPGSSLTVSLGKL